MQVRDVPLFVEVVGSGSPVALLHGGPGADHWSMRPFRRLADRHTTVFYDHRCNGRSGGEVSSMTWDNLTADADALREALGFERWAMLGHSFGGHVALEYALRYPDRLSHLVLLDTAGEARWARDVAPDLLAARGFPRDKVELVRRWFRGDFEPKEMLRILMRIGPAYYSGPSRWLVVRELLEGGWRGRTRPEALIEAGKVLMPGWTVMDRLHELSVPTLVVAGVDDFLFPPECQEQLAAAIPGARLELVEGAGHNAHSEQPRVTLGLVRSFLAETPPGAPGPDDA
jgi:proline iminopeptidase